MNWHPLGTEPFGTLQVCIASIDYFDILYTSKQMMKVASKIPSIFQKLQTKLRMALVSWQMNPWEYDFLNQA